MELEMKIEAMTRTVTMIMTNTKIEIITIMNK